MLVRMTTVVLLPPRGHYLADEVGMLAGVSGNTIGQWSRRGYIRASQSASGYPKVYSFQDCAEAMVVHELLDAGVKLQLVAITIQRLRDGYGDWPLSHAKLLVSSSGCVAREVDERVELVTGREGQVLLNREHLARVGATLTRGGWAAKELPDLEHIEVNPDRLSGRPTIRGRRISAEDVATTATTEDGRESLMEGYGLSEHEINDAVRWWERVQRYEAAA